MPVFTNSYTDLSISEHYFISLCACVITFLVEIKGTGWTFYFFGRLWQCCMGICIIVALWYILVVSFIIVFNDIYCMPRKGGLNAPGFLYLLIAVYSVSAIWRRGGHSIRYRQNQQGNKKKRNKLYTCSYPHFSKHGFCFDTSVVLLIE